MAISHETIRLAAHLRIRVDHEVDDTTRTLVQAWARAWEQVNAEWQAAIDELLADGAGRWPSRRQVARATRAQQALAFTSDRVVQLANQAGVTVTTSARTVTSETAFWQARIMASQLPREVDEAMTALRMDRVDPQALEWIVGRTTEQVTSQLRPLSDRMTEEMRRTLVRGVAVGDNPRKAAADLMRRLEHQFNGGLTRALVITRTEMLDAHRAAAHAQQSANADVLAGWYWNAKLDTRTCPSCWVQHGRLHDLDELGPLDHQQGRCSRLPKVKPWSDLGFEGMDEPDDEIVDSRAAFDALPAADQLAIMGRRRLQALKLGNVTWEDLSQLRPASGWRSSYGVAPLGRFDTPTGPSNTPPGTPPPAKASGLSPSGTPVSQALDVQGGTKAFRDSMNDMLAVIDSVHGDGALPPIPLKHSTSTTARGEYVPFTFGTMVKHIYVASPSDHPEMTMVHELGHFLDHHGLGDGGLKFGTGHPDKEFQAVLDAADASAAIAEVRSADLVALAIAALPNGTAKQIQDYLDILAGNRKYLLRPAEIWGRIYAQWIATRSGNALLLRQIADEITATRAIGLVRQWESADFDPIAKAVDELMKARGWLTKP